MYRGVIIDESLVDKRALEQVRVLSTVVETITPEHATPWLKQWTLHTVEVPDDRIMEVVAALSRSLDAEHGGSWYADFKDDLWHFIVFKGKIFRVDLSDPAAGYRPVKEYGRGLGIPEHQLDFD